MEEKKNKGRGGMIVACVFMCMIIAYLAGLSFCQPFRDFTRTIPYLNQVTIFLCGKEEIANAENAVSKEKKAADNDALKNEGTTTQVKKDETLLAETSKADQSYLDKILFLGDSRTVGMVMNGYIKEEQALAAVGITHLQAYEQKYTFDHTGMTYDFESYIREKQAEIIYISYGINGINYLDEQQYKDGFVTMIDDVKAWSPNSKIVIQSIWPIIENKTMTVRMTPELVKGYNTFLYDLAKEKGCYYLDSIKALEDQVGDMNPLYDNGDGLHYNRAGYDAAFDYILKHPVPNE